MSRNEVVFRWLHFVTFLFFPILWLWTEVFEINEIYFGINLVQIIQISPLLFIIYVIYGILTINNSKNKNPLEINVIIINLALSVVVNIFAWFNDLILTTSEIRFFIISSFILLSFYVLFLEERIHVYFNFDRDIEMYRKARTVGAKSTEQYELVLQVKAPHYKQALLVKKGNFKDFEHFKEGASYGAGNIEQLTFVKKLEAPDWETATKVSNFGSPDYKSYEQAIGKGTKNHEQYLFVLNLNAPDYETALIVAEGNFQDYKIYKKAREKGASNNREYQKILDYNAPNYSKTLEMDKVGFQDYLQFVTAMDEGFANYSTWSFKEDKKQTILKWISSGSEIAMEALKKVSNSSIEDCFLLFSKCKVKASIGENNMIIFEKKLVSETIETIINEFFIKLIIKDESCRVCSKELIGELAFCPHCQNCLHYNCFLNSITALDKCPFCQIKLKINDINNLCLICNSNFVDLKNNISCPNCKTVFHRDHFQEWIKIKGFCKNCKMKINFN